MAEVLNRQTIIAKSTELKTWTVENDEKSITRKFEFSNFVEAFAFMTEIALIAEDMDHHPNWENVYNRVKIKLTTHSVGGLSMLDFNLAEKINRVYNNSLA